MEALNKIKKLRNNANSIYNLFLQKIPQWKSNRGHYDKIGWGFNDDSRFNACEPVSIAFSSHMGTYGSSGCSRQCSLDEDIFKNHLVKYLNKNKETIMLAIAKQMEDEARELKAEAERELKAQLDKLSELDKD